MIDDFNLAIKNYQKKWQFLTAGRKNQAFFEALKPTAVCWKTDDLADLDRRVMGLRTHADIVNYAWINGRWVVVAVLREPLEWGIRIAKIYQRRPDSTDALGLDHVDFYASSIDEDLLAGEPNLKWSHESNSELSQWISLWFDDTEAKLRDNTTLDVIIAEFKQANEQIVG